ncbi:MAG: cation diffusion facilitator family transporter [Candidatus Dormibacteria bacterium]
MSRQTGSLVVLALNLALLGVLVIVGISSHSLGVFAEGGDYLVDAAAVGAAVVGMRLGGGGHGRPGRYPRAPIVVALINAGWLLVLEVIVALAAIYRLARGAPEVQGLPILVVSGVAALVMMGGALILRGEVGAGDDDAGGDLSLAAVMLDTVADATAAAGVALAGAVIWLTHGWYWLDPAVALVIAAIIGYHAVRLLVKVIPRLRGPISTKSG